MLLEKIKKDSLIARKNSDSYAKSMLITLSGELETEAKRTGKEITDENVLALIKSYVKNNIKAISKMKDSNADKNEVASLEKDNAFWDTYLPSQMSESELRSVIEVQVNSGENIGGVMSYLKKNHSAQYDAGMASKITRELISK